MLTEYNGDIIIYDNIGNPIQYGYRDYQFTWEMGNQLESVYKLSTGELLYQYTYNEDGLRISSTDVAENTTTYYTWVNGMLTSQKTDTNMWYFIYDSNKTIVGFTFNGEAYLYIKNLQGDIIGILDSAGNQIVEYTYDAWGNVLSIIDSSTNAIGANNPFRYRGYFFDNDTGFYYLQNRYYDAQVGRFINSDDVKYLGASETILGYNLFAYCENNVINYSDQMGNYITVYMGKESWKDMVNRHYNYNSSQDKNWGWKYILNQDKDADEFMYGGVGFKRVLVKRTRIFMFVYNYYKYQYNDLYSDYNGCGWIATYNALLLMGKRVKPSSIIKWYESNNGLILNGLFGTNPLSIAKYFRNQWKYTVKTGYCNLSKASSVETLSELIKKGKSAVLTFGWADLTDIDVGAHNIAVKYDVNKKKFAAYNLGKQIQYYSDLQSLLKAADSVLVIKNKQKDLPIYYTVICS